MKSATEELKEGIKALHTRQKLIRLADRSDLGWAVVDAYESDELASEDEDAKRMKEARRVADLKDQKEKKKKQAASRRGGRATNNGWRMQPLPYASNAAPMAPGAHRFVGPPIASGATRPQQVGPCFYCLEMGHLKAHCPKKSQLYPLIKLTSNSADVVCNNSVICGNDHSYVTNGHQTEHKSSQSSTAGTEVLGFLGCQVDGSPESLELDRYWELEHNPEQTADVQGRLKAQVSFWRDALQAPELIIDSITNGYKLPLLSAPPPSI